MKYLVSAALFSVCLLFNVSYAGEQVNAAQSAHQKLVHSFRSKSQYTKPVDLNHAAVSDLMTLKGVGPKRAAAIVSYRQSHGPFKSVEELLHVRGVGKKGLARLKTNNLGRLAINTSQNMK